MAVKSSVFGSRAEKRGFLSIESTWGNYRVLPQFPFSALFEPDKTIRGPYNLFFTTSIDYVVCTKGGEPLLAIDFDGLGRGFNKRQYVQVEPTTDRNRKQKYDFKLKYAARYGLPYYILAGDELVELDPDCCLTVADAIIGNELGQREFHDKIPHLLDALPTGAPVSIHDRLFDLEFESYMKHNPVLQKTLEIRTSLDVLGWGFPPNMVRYPPNDHANEVKCEYTLRATPFGDISVTGSVRAVGKYHVSIVREIAELLALLKFARLLRSADPTQIARPGGRVLS